MSPTDLRVDESQQKHDFLLLTAELLHKYGTPSYRLEAVMEKMADCLGVHGSFLYTPTALIIGLGENSRQRTYVRRAASSTIDIGKLVAIDATLEELESGDLTVAQASERLRSTDCANAPFSPFLSMAAAGVACAGVAVIFGGNVFEMLVAGTMGLVIELCSLFTNRFSVRGLLEPMLGFCVALISVLVAQVIDIDSRLVTLAALILPIPGLSLTLAFNELAEGHLSSGSARLAGALVSLFTLVVGVAIAWRITGIWLDDPAGTTDPLPWWCLWLAVATAPFAFAVVFKAPTTQWLIIAAVAICGYAAGRILAELTGPETGAFAGAFAVGCGSNMFARIRNQPAMISQTPGILIMVPGSLGYKSLMAMVDNDTLRGVELAFSTSITGAALVGGLLLANQLISPKRHL